MIDFEEYILKPLGRFYQPAKENEAITGYTSGICLSILGKTIHYRYDTTVREYAHSNPECLERWIKQRLRREIMLHIEKEIFGEML